MPWDDEVARLLGGRVRQLRERRAMSQEALACRAGCSKNHVQVIEAAGRADLGRPINLRLSTLFGLADALGVEPWDLVREPAAGA
ncbi:helix-turn-helix transcriptional regulator [Nocardioides carbamazepini]|uniref:helix-turn-helix domain-containing protein n=1 Tax=Nocardioides carbamazepini TaxID=2854259 RepID=UPI002149A944|nr:helix-turn-helix transcriptional regulator [Nocardioides carbamazepini]MCR1782046.1 helix-turn-helix transcriptional regulator [Nocardioides carbamazepini]